MTESDENAAAAARGDSGAQRSVMSPFTSKRAATMASVPASTVGGNRCGISWAPGLTGMVKARPNAPNNMMR